MQFTEYFAAQLGRPVSAILPLTLFKFDGNAYSVVHWDASLGNEPTPAQLAEISERLSGSGLEGAHLQVHQQRTTWSTSRS